MKKHTHAAAINYLSKINMPEIHDAQETLKDIYSGTVHTLKWLEVIYKRIKKIKNIR
jgi:hypothetical protein